MNEPSELQRTSPSKDSVNFNQVLGEVGEKLAQEHLQNQGILPNPQSKEFWIGEFLIRSMKFIGNITPTPDIALSFQIKTRVREYPPDFIAVKNRGDHYVVDGIVEVKIRKPKIQENSPSNLDSPKENLENRRLHLVYEPFAKHISSPELKEKDDGENEFDTQISQARKILENTISHINKIIQQEQTVTFDETLGSNELEMEIPALNPQYLHPSSPREQMEEAIGFSIDKPLMIASDFKIWFVTAADHDGQIPKLAEQIKLPSSYEEILETTNETVPNDLSINGDREYMYELEERILLESKNTMIPVLKKLFGESLDGKDNQEVEEKLLSFTLGRTASKEEISAVSENNVPPLVRSIWLATKELLKNPLPLNDNPYFAFAIGKKSNLSWEDTPAFIELIRYHNLTPKEVLAASTFFNYLVANRESYKAHGIPVGESLSNSIKKLIPTSSPKLESPKD